MERLVDQAWAGLGQRQTSKNGPGRPLLNPPQLDGLPHASWRQQGRTFRAMWVGTSVDTWGAGDQGGEVGGPVGGEVGVFLAPL